jgi:sugar lactone lactonase YvrE
LFVAATVVLVLVYLFLAPSPIDPVAYEPPARPTLTGNLEPNTRLHDAEALAVGQLAGPEDVETDSAGQVYTGLADGRIVRLAANGAVEEFVNTGGRPLGLEFDSRGNLFVADAVKGLLRVAPDGEITTLLTEAEGQPLGFTDDLDVSSEGVIYFSDASSKFGNGEYLYDLLESRPHGRLIAHDPRSRQTKVLLKDLYFANGVALSRNEDFVLVNETYRYRITRYWLKGPKASTADTFVENLPGFPDNVTANRQGTFWVALFTLRNDTLDWLSPRPAVKKLLAKLPKMLWPAPQPYGFVLALDEQGRILESLQDPDGKKFPEVTAAHQRGDKLYLGSLSNDRIGRYSLP